MNKKIKSTVIILLAFIAGSIKGISQAVKVSYGGQKIPDNLIAPNSKKIQPVAFNPFIADAKGESFPPTVTLYNGQQMDREAYLKELNAIEVELNKKGYSLRDDQKNVLLNKLRNTLNKSADLQSANSLPPASFISIARLHNYMSTTIPNVATTYPIIPRGDILLGGQKATKTVVDEIAPINYSYGDPQTLSAAVYAGYKLTSKAEPLYGLNYATASVADMVKNIKNSKSDFSMKVGTWGNVGVLGQDVKLFEASFALDAPSNASQKLSKQVILYRFGKSIINEDDSYDGDNKSINKLDADTLNWQLTAIKIPIAGPLDIETNFSLFGSIGIEYNCNLNRLGVSASVRPFIYTRAILEGSVGVSKIARLGVGGELTFANAQVLGGIQSGISTSPAGWILTNKTFLNLDLTFLQGRLYGFAEIDLGLYKHRYEHDFYNYPGINFQKKIIDRDKSITFKDWDALNQQQQTGF